MLKAGLAAVAALLAAVVLIATVTTVIIAAVINSALDLIPLPIPRPDTATPHTSAPPTPGPTTPSRPPNPTQPCIPAAPRDPAPVPGYSRDQMANAATIVAVGTQLGVPEQGQVVAIAAALAESGLRNLNQGDRDSLGLFQQRPSQGWGIPQQILTPTYAATQFYQHLLAIPNWQHLSINDAAQAVQRSATPQVYAQYEQTARNIVNTTCTPPAHPPRTRNNPAQMAPLPHRRRKQTSDPTTANPTQPARPSPSPTSKHKSAPPTAGDRQPRSRETSTTPAGTAAGSPKPPTPPPESPSPKQRKTNTTPAPKSPPHPHHNPATSSTTEAAPHTSPTSDLPSPPQKWSTPKMIKN